MFNLSGTKQWIKKIGTQCVHVSTADLTCKTINASTVIAQIYILKSSPLTWPLNTNRNKFTKIMGNTLFHASHFGFTFFKFAYGNSPFYEAKSRMSLNENSHKLTNIMWHNSFYERKSVVFGFYFFYWICESKHFFLSMSSTVTQYLVSLQRLACCS